MILDVGNLGPLSGDETSSDFADLHAAVWCSTPATITLSMYR
jgi:hypothetical protein